MVYEISQKAKFIFIRYRARSFFLCVVLLAIEKRICRELRKVSQLKKSSLVFLISYYQDLTMNISVFKAENASDLLKDILEAHNVFKDPYQSTIIRIIAVACWLTNFAVLKTIISFVKNEAEDLNKTIINLLVVFSYLMVSKKDLQYSLQKKKTFPRFYPNHFTRIEALKILLYKKLCSRLSFIERKPSAPPKI